MVDVDGKQVRPLSEETSKSIKIGNDERQFIIRIPVSISKHTILKDFKKKYTADIVVNVSKPNELLVRLKHGEA